jgi:hypothetical protein
LHRRDIGTQRSIHTHTHTYVLGSIRQHGQPVCRGVTRMRRSCFRQPCALLGHSRADGQCGRSRVMVLTEWRMESTPSAAAVAGHSADRRSILSRDRRRSGRSIGQSGKLMCQRPKIVRLCHLTADCRHTEQGWIRQSIQHTGGFEQTDHRSQPALDVWPFHTCFIAHEGQWQPASHSDHHGHQQHRNFNGGRPFS